MLSDQRPVTRLGGAPAAEDPDRSQPIWICGCGAPGPWRPARRRLTCSLCERDGAVEPALPADYPGKICSSCNREWSFMPNLGWEIGGAARAAAIGPHLRAHGVGLAAEPPIVVTAVSIQIVAEQKAGRFLAAREKNPGTRVLPQETGRPRGGSTVEPPRDVPTLADLGLTKKESHQGKTQTTVPGDAQGVAPPETDEKPLSGASESNDSLAPTWRCDACRRSLSRRDALLRHNRTREHAMRSQRARHRGRGSAAI